MIKVAINGFGRIGRALFKQLLSKYENIKIVAINDLADTKTMAHLLKYDSVYGVYEKRVEAKKDGVEVNKVHIPVFAEKDPENLPWGKLEVDVVLECTGLFTDYEDAKKHLKAGASKVIISAPSDSEEVPHYVVGVNEKDYNPKEEHVISMASCTTNCLAPLAKVIDDSFGIEKGLMTTMHSYTGSQNLLDGPNPKDLRRARAAAVSIVPTTTGAAKATTKVLPHLEGKIDGLAVRVPTPVVSLVDFVVKIGKKTTVEEVNYTLRRASLSEGLKGILGVEDAPLVSVDYKGHSFSSVVDMESTRVQKEDLVKILAWYDNEWGYATRLAEMTAFVGNRIE